MEETQSLSEFASDTVAESDNNVIVVVVTTIVVAAAATAGVVWLRRRLRKTEPAQAPEVPDLQPRN